MQIQNKRKNNKITNECSKSSIISKKTILNLLNTPQSISTAMRRSLSSSILSLVPSSSNLLSNVRLAPSNPCNNVKLGMNCLHRPTLAYPTLSIESDDGEIYYVENFDLITQPKFIIPSFSLNSIKPVSNKLDNLKLKNCKEDLNSKHNFQYLYSPESLYLASCNASSKNLFTANSVKLEEVDDDNGNLSSLSATKH